MWDRRVGMDLFAGIFEDWDEFLLQSIHLIIHPLHLVL